jgi:hypothetical protein
MVRLERKAALAALVGGPLWTFLVFTSIAPVVHAQAGPKPKATAAERAPSAKAAADSKQQTVYVTRTGKAYHRDGCRSLARSGIPMDLSEATKRYRPCGICKPPTETAEKTSGGASQKESAAAPASGASRAAPADASGRCEATTKKGTRCSRAAKAGSKFCWQHGG